MMKLDLARYVVKVLWNMDHLPSPDNHNVIRVASRRKDVLERQYEMAQAAEASTK